MSNKFKVAVSEMSPFVVEHEGKYSGFEVELWEMIAREMKVDFEYEKHIFQDLLPLVCEKKVDVAFASITINEKREEIVDFSHPTFNSGLQILLNKNRRNINFGSTIRTLFKEGYRQLIKPLLFLLLILFVLGSIVFFAERNGESIASSYFPGFLQAAWISLSSMLGLDGGFFVYTVNSWLGRFIVAFGQIISLAIFGLFIGEISAFITTKKIKLNIEGPNDLKDKIVATVKGTTSEIILKDLGAKVIPVIKIDEAYKKLKNNQVDAIVFDSPVLIYYALNDGVEWAEVVGELFAKQDYGLVLHDDSDIRKDVNLAILKLRENGSYNALYKKYFGDIE